jgi:flagellar biosynthesis regulator FlaF
MGTRVRTGTARRPGSREKKMIDSVTWSVPIWATMWHRVNTMSDDNSDHQRLERSIVSAAITLRDHRW